MKSLRSAFPRSCRAPLAAASVLSLFTSQPLLALQGASAEQPNKQAAVQAQMSNVMYHFQDDVAVHIRRLAGELVPVRGAPMPVFDDKQSFLLDIVAGEISLTPQALANVLNRNVFAGPDAPIKDLSLSIDKDRLKIKGRMHGKGDLHFETEGKLSATSDGKIRLHVEEIRALHLPVKGLLDLFGVDLADLIKQGKVRGVVAEKDDLIFDLEQILPPPHIIGKVTNVRLEGGSILQTFGNPGTYKWTRVWAGNYMGYRGNRLQFGKLIMNDTDLVLIDLDPKDPFDFYLDHYKDQLTAGYTKITKDFGLRVFMADFNKLKRPVRTSGEENKAK